MQGQLFLEKMAKFPIVHKLEQDEQTEISISCLNLSLHRMIMIPVKEGTEIEQAQKGAKLYVV